MFDQLLVPEKEITANLFALRLIEYGKDWL